MDAAVPATGASAVVAAGVCVALAGFAAAARTRRLDAQRGDSEAAGDGAAGPPPHRQPQISRRIAEFEASNDCRVVFAAECSSRVFGWAHEHSDHDIVAIFVKRRREYFSLRPPDSAARRQFAGREACPDVDITGFEARHAIGLAAAHNPTLLEAVHSPLVYRDLGGGDDAGGASWRARMQACAAKHADRRVFAKGLLSHAAGNNKANIIAHKPPATRPVLKKHYCQVLRKLLAVASLERAGALPCFVDLQPSSSAAAAAAAFPPLDFLELLDDDAAAVAAPSSGSVPAEIQAQLRGWMASGSGLRDAVEPGSVEALNHCIEALITRLTAVVGAALPPSRLRKRQPTANVDAAADTMLEQAVAQLEAAQAAGLAAWDEIIVDMIDKEACGW
eukprot:SAG22_NODE_69_length_22779_cov_71.088139_10_plen_391_part_00